MPDDDARKKAGERLAADLRTLREERGLSADDLRGRLRVPDGLFQAFESGRLVGHPMFNRVYLRSLTRSYASAAGVPSAVALSALDATLEGSYEEGQLQREIKTHEESDEQEAAERDVEEETKKAAPEAETSRQSEEEQSAEAAAAASGAAAGAAASQETSQETSQEPDWTTQSPPSGSAEEAERRQQEKEEQAHARQQEREERAQKQDRAREERASVQSEQQQQRQQQERPSQRDDRAASRRSRRERSDSSNVGKWIVGALALVAVAALVFFLVRSPGDAGSPETAQSTTATTDTAAGGSEQAEQEDQRPAANLQLGETMNFTVVAQGGPVQDLKVTRDQDVRRPYWIEQGQAKVFPARERIVIENPPGGGGVLQNVRLLAEGYPYPTDQRDGQGRIVITRQSLQSFADTLRGQPAQLSAQRDTASLSGL